jgi:hypothetical protein
MPSTCILCRIQLNKLRPWFFLPATRTEHRENAAGLIAWIFARRNLAVRRSFKLQSVTAFSAATSIILHLPKTASGQKFLLKLVARSAMFDPVMPYTRFRLGLAVVIRQNELGSKCAHAEATRPSNTDPTRSNDFQNSTKIGTGFNRQTL